MKSKFNNAKRGFTIVELVIVIAIIAILAAVLIPTFSSLVQSAQMASDTSLITNLNKELAMAEAKDDKNATMSDVIKDLENAGYSLALLTPTAEGCYIAWDADTDRVVYMDSEFKILYPKENKGETLANAWQIAHNKEQLDKYAALGKPFNVYLASGFDAIELVVSYGIDVGDNTGITKLSYVNTSGSAKNVVIRTINGGNYELLSTNPKKASLIQIGSEYYKATSDDFLGGIVTINGGVFDSKKFCVVCFAKGELTINGGIFKSTNNAVIGTDGTGTFGGNTITINGGTFNGNIKEEGYIACGIYLANKDTLVVNGGTFNITNGVGILVRSGKATIGKDVVINTNNKQLTTASGKVGDSNVKINVSLEIVIDKKSGYPGENPVIEKNESKYDVFDNAK